METEERAVADTAKNDDKPANPEDTDAGMEDENFQNVQTESVVDGGVLQLQDVLNPEAIFNLEMGNPDVVFTKAKLDQPLLSNDEFTQVLDSLIGSPVLTEKSTKLYGEAMQIIFQLEKFSTEKFKDASIPFNFSNNLLGKRCSKIFRETGLDQWLNVGGALPTVFPIFDGVSNPSFSFSVAGGHVTLQRAPFRLSAVSYIAKGETIWQIVPPNRSDELTDAIRDILIENRCSRDLTRCSQFIQHRNFYLDPEYLKKNFDAIEIVLREGDIIFLEPNTHFQMLGRTEWMTISYKCTSSKWLKLDASETCRCNGYSVMIDDRIPLEITKIRERAARQFNYAAVLKKLCDTRSRNPSITYDDMRYETTIKSQKRCLGQIIESETQTALDSGAHKRKSTTRTHSEVGGQSKKKNIEPTSSKSTDKTRLQEKKMQNETQSEDKNAEALDVDKTKYTIRCGRCQERFKDNSSFAAHTSACRNSNENN